MKSPLKRIFLLTGVCLVYASDAWARGCEVQLSNAPGAIVESHTNWWDQGEDGFTVYTYIDGVQVLPNDEYGIERLPADYPCTGYCWPMRFVAKSWNVTIYNQLVAGNWSGWKCSQEAQVVGYSQGSIMFVALSQDEKDQLWKDAAKMGEAARLFALIAATFKSFGPDPVAQLIVKAATFGALGSKWAQIYLEAEAADPDDEDYGSPYEAPLYSAADLGFEYCSETAYCDDFVNTIPRIQQMGEGAYVSLNRSGTCARRGNSDCAKWQGDRARWYLRAQGDAERDAGYYLWMLRENANDGYSPDCDCYFSQVLYQAAGDFWNSGEYLRNRY